MTAGTRVGRIDELLEAAISTLAGELGIAPADAGRTLLGSLARWFGIDFAREADAADAALEDRDAPVPPSTRAMARRARALAGIPDDEPVRVKR